MILAGTVSFDQAKAVLDAAELDMSAQSPSAKSVENSWTDDLLPSRKDH